MHYAQGICSVCCTSCYLLVASKVNEAARQAVPVTSSIQPLSDAIAAGAVAMFRSHRTPLDAFHLHALQLFVGNRPMFIYFLFVLSLMQPQREVWQQREVSEDGWSIARALCWHARDFYQRHVRDMICALRLSMRLN
jgi:hypothetical protein